MSSVLAVSPSVAGTTVVVPVHGVPRIVAECIRALECHAGGERVLLIDDASPDSTSARQLEDAAARNARWSFHHQPERRGFTATINEGCRLSGHRDVVLLNSDTRVTSGWLGGLLEVAAADSATATVTPVSNNAGPFSVPFQWPGTGVPLPDETMADLVAKSSPGLSPTVPTGHGFCLFVRRSVLAAIGGFDENSFPEGVGEENDFCVRASRAGYRHRLADTVYVFHHGSASFGWRKHWLMWKSARTLARRYPDYRGSVAEMLADDPLEPLRRGLIERLLALEQRND